MLVIFHAASKPPLSVNSRGYQTFHFQTRFRTQRSGLHPAGFPINPFSTVKSIPNRQTKRYIFYFLCISDFAGSALYSDFCFLRNTHNDSCIWATDNWGECIIIYYHANVASPYKISPKDIVFEKTRMTKMEIMVPTTNKRRRLWHCRCLWKYPRYLKINGYTFSRLAV
jgi:hypothetical protein